MLTMQGRGRIAWRGNASLPRRCSPVSWRVAWLTHASTPSVPRSQARCPKPALRHRFNPAPSGVPYKPKPLLEGFCPEPHPEEQIALNANGLILFLRLGDIEWLQAAGNGVELRVGRQTYQLSDPLAVAAAKLPPNRFLRISPWTLVNVEHIRDLEPISHGQYQVRLHSGIQFTLMRGYLPELLCLQQPSSPRNRRFRL